MSEIDLNTNNFVSGLHYSLYVSFNVDKEIVFVNYNKLNFNYQR